MVKPPRIQVLVVTSPIEAEGLAPRCPTMAVSIYNISTEENWARMAGTASSIVSLSCWPKENLSVHLPYYAKIIEIFVYLYDYKLTHNMDTKEKFVVTISREIGSGGHTVGKKLAEKLGVHCSDKELIRRLMDQFNLDAAEIERIKGEKKNWFNDFLLKVAPIPFDQNPLMKVAPNGEVRHLPEPEELIQAERDILRSIAAEGSCVVVGRSGFEVLKDFPNKVDIFITAPRESRIKRVMVKQHLNEETTIWSSILTGLPRIRSLR